MTGQIGVPVVLASASTARAQLLRAAGVALAIDPAAIDEDEVKAALRRSGADGAVVAERLAELKALRIANRHPAALVIGADQVLQQGAEFYDKPPDLATARRQLLALRGRTHDLISAVVIVRDGVRLWHHVGRARLTMRAFTDQFLDQYLNDAGDEALGSVGAYRLEGKGVQFFQRIEGDYFTILGLPLLPVVDFLREQGVLPS